jgi:hypothetical protein
MDRLRLAGIGLWRGVLQVLNLRIDQALASGALALPFEVVVRSGDQELLLMQENDQGISGRAENLTAEMFPLTAMFYAGAAIRGREVFRVEFPTPPAF